MIDMKADNVCIIGLVLLFAFGFFIALSPIDIHQKSDEIAIQTGGDKPGNFQYELHKRSYIISESSPWHVMAFSISGIGAFIGLIMVVTSLWRIIEPTEKHKEKN